MLSSLNACSNNPRAQNAALCDASNSQVTYAGAGVSQGCGADLLDNSTSKLLGCDRAAGCVLVKKQNELENYFCAPSSRLNTDTREWGKPPRAVQVGTADGKAVEIPSKSGFCQAHGYVGGACDAQQVVDNRHRIASCECALDAKNNPLSACDTATSTCGDAGDTLAVWCCDAPNTAAPCGLAATTSAVVADITTVFRPHSARTAVATLHTATCAAFRPAWRKPSAWSGARQTSAWAWGCLCRTHFLLSRRKTPTSCFACPTTTAQRATCATFPSTDLGMTSSSLIWQPGRRTLIPSVRRTCQTPLQRSASPTSIP